MSKDKTVSRTHYFCRVCGEQTDTRYNINLKAVSICEKCARQITKQELADMFLNQKEKQDGK